MIRRADTPAAPAGDPAAGGDVHENVDEGGDPPLRVRGLTVAYHRVPVLDGADLDVPAGSLTAVVGPNGAGKSTLLKAALGLIPAAAGTARFWGEPLGRVRGRVGYVPQRSEVDWDFPVTAAGVVEMGLYRRAGWFLPLSRAHREEAATALDRVGMAEYADRQIARLSGGQQQRVFLARALVQRAELYLMDEPFAGVDAATERAIVDLLKDLRDRGDSVVAVHHDLATVADYFDRVVLLNKTVRAAGPVADAFTPAALRDTYGGRLALLADPPGPAGPAGAAR